MSKPLIETLSFKLNDGVSTEQFLILNKFMEETYVYKQEGFISRETSVSEDGTWFINVHWKSKADSDKSIAGFDGAASAGDFFAMMNMDSFKLVQHQIQ